MKLELTAAPMPLRDIELADNMCVPTVTAAAPAPVVGAK
jgi:hypothetical protein